MTNPETLPADAELLLDNQLCFPLYTAARQVVALYTPVLKPLGLTYTQYVVLLVLWEQQELSVGEIGRRLHLDSGTLTPLLKRMEAGGLVERSRSGSEVGSIRCMTQVDMMMCRRFSTKVASTMARKPPCSASMPAAIIWLAPA